MTQTSTAPLSRADLATQIEADVATIHARFGARLGWDGLQRLLADRTLVRYATEVVFDAAPLMPGEFARAIPNGENPEEGFVIAVHPLFQTQLEQVPVLVLYRLAAIHYGEQTTTSDSAIYGAQILGLSRDAYYSQLGDAVDRLASQPIVGLGCRTGCDGCHGGGCDGPCHLHDN